jgi:hypothetical protein
MPQPLSNNDREALVIRLKALYRLALLDYFNVSQDYTRVIVKEILDIEQAVLKSFALANKISVPERGFPIDLFNNISNIFEGDSGSRLNNIHSELGSLRNVFRNPETHQLCLPMPPPETAKRCLKRLKELVDIIDPIFANYLRGESFSLARLIHFYHEVVTNDTISYRDETVSKLLIQIKQRTDNVRIRTEKGQIMRGEVVEEERSPDNIVKLIESGYLNTDEFRAFIAAVSTDR